MILWCDGTLASHNRRRRYRVVADQSPQSATWSIQLSTNGRALNVMCLHATVTFNSLQSLQRTSTVDVNGTQIIADALAIGDCREPLTGVSV